MSKNYQEFITRAIVVNKLTNERLLYNQNDKSNLKITFNINVNKSDLLYTSFENIVGYKLLSKCEQHEADFLEVSPKLYEIILNSDLSKRHYLEDLDNLGVDGVEFGIGNYYKVILIKNNDLSDSYFLISKYLKNKRGCLGYLKGKVMIPRSL